MTKLNLLARLVVVLAACSLVVTLSQEAGSLQTESSNKSNGLSHGDKQQQPHPHPETSLKDAKEAEEEEDHSELLHETISASRGERDGVGVRDQWSSNEHLKTSYDSRRQPSERVQALLQQYHLDCQGCDHAQAVAKLNAFVAESKRYAAEQEAQRIAWENKVRWMKSLLVALVVGCLGFCWYYLKNDNDNLNHINPFQGGRGYGRTDEQVQTQEFESVMMEERRLRAAAAAQQRMAQNNMNNAEDDNSTWTTEQKLQFEDALNSIDNDIPPTLRFKLLAEKVGKTPQDCQNYHERQQMMQQQASNKKDAALYRANTSEKAK